MSHVNISRKYHFYAAHRNRAAGDKCARLHGHTYDVIVQLRMKVQDNGISMLFDDIDKLIEPIVRQFDHWLVLMQGDPLIEVLANANEPFTVFPYEGPTSAENMAIFFHQQISDLKICPAQGITVTVAETKSSIVSYGD